MTNNTSKGNRCVACPRSTRNDPYRYVEYTHEGFQYWHKRCYLIHFENKYYGRCAQQREKVG
jgi:hypothetical protein